MIKITCSIIFLCFINIFPQVETIPADHPVYPFLKAMFVKGNLEQYDDVVLPFSKQKVISFLKEIDSHSNRLSTAEREFLCRMEVRLGMKEN